VNDDPPARLRARQLTEQLLAPATPEDTAPTATRTRRLWARLRGSEPVPGLRTAKAALATALAFVAAQALPGAEPPVVAALTALLVVQVTPYQSIRTGWQRIGSVVAGVLVAILLSAVVGLHWWSLALTVLIALVIAYALRLGDNAVEVPISAMLVLAVAGNRDVGLDRVYETLVGAAVGVLASLVLPRTYLGPAGVAVGNLASEIADVLRDDAATLENEWSHQRAMEGLRRARALEGAVSNARKALARAEDGVRLNPRAILTAHVPEALRPGLTALEYAAINVRVISRSLVDRVSGVAAARHPGTQTRLAVARLLRSTADAVQAFGVAVAEDVQGPPRHADELREALARAHLARAEANQLLLDDAGTDPARWRVNGALLAHVARLLADIDPDAETVSTAVNRPEPAEPPPRTLRRLSTRLMRRQQRLARKRRR
jgi:hypothetical protein